MSIEVVVVVVVVVVVFVVVVDVVIVVVVAADLFLVRAYIISPAILPKENNSGRKTVSQTWTLSTFFSY